MAGNFSFTLFCALSPATGGSRTGFGGGGGVCHEEKAFGTPHVTFANGFFIPPPSCSTFDVELPSDFGKEGSDTFPRPALWRAILVPILLNILVVRRAFHEISKAMIREQLFLTYSLLKSEVN